MLAARLDDVAMEKWIVLAEQEKKSDSCPVGCSWLHLWIP